MTAYTLVTSVLVNTQPGGIDGELDELFYEPNAPAITCAANHAPDGCPCVIMGPAVKTAVLCMALLGHITRGFETSNGPVLQHEMTSFEDMKRNLLFLLNSRDEDDVDAIQQQWTAQAGNVPTPTEH